VGDDILDIIDPTAPPLQHISSVVWIAGLLVAVLLIFGVVAYAWFRGRHRRRARRSLAQLSRAVRAGVLPHGEAAYQIAALLQGVLRMSHIAPGNPPSGCRNPQRWEDFVTQLDVLRYQPQTGQGAGDGDAAALAGMARAFLKEGC
jgi:hypothetical protein